MGVTGISMGGQLAATAAATMPAEVAVAPCIPSRSPAPVFTRGALRRMVDWAALRRAWGEDAPERLRALLDTADVCALPPPRRPDCAVVVGARYDACVPPGAAEEIHRHWPGSELRVLGTGHAGAVAFRGAALAAAAADAVERLAAGTGGSIRDVRGG